MAPTRAFVRAVLASLVFAVLLCAGRARAGDLEAALGAFGDGEPEAVAAAVTRLGALGDPAALPALEALRDGRLFVDADGNALVEDAQTKTLTRAADGQRVDPRPLRLKTAAVNNAVRRALLPALALLELRAPDPNQRRAAAEELAKRPLDEAIPALRAALARETDGDAKTAIGLALARADLASDDPERRIAAIRALGESGQSALKEELTSLVSKRDDGSYVEPDPRVRDAAGSALSAIERKQTFVGFAGNTIYGLSLASVLLLTALGLAITFGVMGVINMAHGEMLMIGAYSTYAVERVFEQHWPSAFSYYLVAAVPTAFVVCFAVGVVLERAVIRFLYGRPLETLLATWGISLMLIQTVRIVFGAQNVSVANPPWLSGGAHLADGLVVPYSRIATIVFALTVLAFVGYLLKRTRFGLQVRAVTQNRAMASCLGISTARVDMWTFGLGSAVGGLGGVALSQLGNVGPEMGQAYIVDSFMVVVLGGVGKLVGTVVSAVGLGMLHKYLEPIAGAVLGKIAMLLFVILFIQKRPQGLFAMTERQA